MKLTQMKRTAKGTLVSYRSPATDLRGDSRYEVSVDGPKDAVEKALGEADFKFDIDPGGTEEDMNRRIAELLEPYRREMTRRATDPARLTPQRPPSKDPAVGPRTITVSIRPTAEHGTFWLFDTIVPIPLPAGPVPFQVVFPPVSAGGMASFPTAGNPNVRIRFNSPFPPNVAASTLGGLSIDVTSFLLPPFSLVTPFYQWPVAAAPCVARLMCWGLSVWPF